MALTRIEYGSLASSSVMNNNFDYLDDRIAEVVTNSNASIATINSNISTINSSISDLTSDFQSDLASVQTTFNSVISASGLYVTTYVNGTSWYREYFSNSNKTTRVWLEQGFKTPSVNWGDNAQKTYDLIKAFKNTNYTVIVTSTLMYVGNGVSSGNVAVEDVKTNKITLGNDASNTFAVRVYACGV